MFDEWVRRSLQGTIPMVVFSIAVVAGVLALWMTPREEEPQIVVPVVDVVVSAPGLSAEQVSRQVTVPLEKLLSQIPGVEHVYSTSLTGRSTVTLRFYVGEDRETSLLNTYNKLHSNRERIPGVVSDWFVHPVEVDDVPIVVLSMWSSAPDLYGDYELRRLAEEISTSLQGIDDTSQVEVIGGRSRVVRVAVDPDALAARNTTLLEVFDAIGVSNQLQHTGAWLSSDRSILLQSGDYIRTVSALRDLIINVINGDPVYLKDIATVEDRPDLPGSYTWIDFPDAQGRPMVAISVAKQRGSNAVSVARDVHHEVEILMRDVIPPEVHIEVIRDYGETANAKVNNLTQSLGFAVLTVVVFIGIFLGWRQALVVALAVPVCYGITLSLDFAFGYTINRVTLFALILSLGLLVDDPITGIDNISRHLGVDGGLDAIVASMREIRVPLIMSTLTIIAAFVPLAFISGMMGPYMAPMAFNVPVAVIVSTLVAFFITPWLASRLLGAGAASAPDAPDAPDALREGTGMKPGGVYSRILTRLTSDRRLSKQILWLTGGLFAVALVLVVLREVPLKLLPFDNRNEVQVLIDAPEGTSLEATAAIANKVSHVVLELVEVDNVAAFVGVASPMDFNGMVRRYYGRNLPHHADLRLSLVDKEDREHQSHAVVLRLRDRLAELATDGVVIKVVEVPPGPPVLSTLVAEVYGPLDLDYAVLQQRAELVMARVKREPHVDETDSSIEAPQTLLRFVLDKQKAALSGVGTAAVNGTMALAGDGGIAGYMPFEREAVPLPIKVELDLSNKSDRSDFLQLRVKGEPGRTQVVVPAGLDATPQPIVALGEIGHLEERTADTAIHHKDLRRVVYVMAELSGRTPAAVLADITADRRSDVQQNADVSPSPWEHRTFATNGGGDLWSVPDGTEVSWQGEGEWRITLDVFRDMGIGFAFALIVIFVLLRIQTGATSLALIIMSAIPLTLIGIIPGFWLLNQIGERTVAGAPDPVLFTATAMIGMIALAGIVVRNSLILVEFIAQARRRGAAIAEAIITAGATRIRPVLLTAGTTLLGNIVITFDPVFSGLALAIIFGIVSSTVFTLCVVPIVYYLVFTDAEGNER